MADKRLSEILGVSEERVDYLAVHMSDIIDELNLSMGVGDKIKLLLKHIPDLTVTEAAWLGYKIAQVQVVNV